MTNSRVCEEAPALGLGGLPGLPATPPIISPPYKNRGQSGADHPGPLLIRTQEKLGTSSRHCLSWVTRQTHSLVRFFPHQEGCALQPAGPLYTILYRPSILLM